MALWSVMLIVTLLTTVVFAEVLLRLAGTNAFRTIRTAPSPVFDRIPGVYEPNQHLRDTRYKDLVHQVTINSLGYRGESMQMQKHAGTLRLLCLGDSFTYGKYVSDEDTFPYQLQRRFREHHIPVEVVNGGVEDTTIVDQAVFLEKSLIIKPDVVLLVFYQNDIEDLSRPEPVYAALARHRRMKSSWLMGTAYSLFRDTAIVDYILSMNVRSGWAEKQERIRALSPEDRDVLWRRYETALRAMARDLEARHITLVFAIYPAFRQLDDRESVAQELTRIEEIGHRVGVKTITLTPALKRAQRPVQDLYLLPKDDHPRALAHRLVADEIFTALRTDVERLARTVGQSGSPGRLGS